MLQSSGLLAHDRPLDIKLPFGIFALGTVALPLIGLILCVIIAFSFHFEDATGAHCQVSNYLPSISAAISLSPECYIWRLCVGLHSAPRVVVAFAYFRFYQNHFSTRFPEGPLTCLNLIFSICENIGLLLLTNVSSSETYFVHKEGFVLFIVSSLFHMVITCQLWKSLQKCSLSPEHARSHHWKWRLLLVSVCFYGFAGFFYWKHNMHCEPGSYTFFALFEYLVVLSNMAFHLTAMWDFKSQTIALLSIF